MTDIRTISTFFCFLNFYIFSKCCGFILFLFGHMHCTPSLFSHDTWLKYSCLIRAQGFIRLWRKTSIKMWITAPTLEGMKSPLCTLMNAFCQCSLQTASKFAKHVRKERRETGFILPSAHYSHITIIIASASLNIGSLVVLILLKTKGIIATHKSHHTPAHLNEQRRTCSIQSLDQYLDLNKIWNETR